MRDAFAAFFAALATASRLLRRLSVRSRRLASRSSLTVQASQCWVSQRFTSWNLIGGWLTRLDGLRSIVSAVDLNCCGPQAASLASRVTFAETEREPRAIHERPWQARSILHR